MPGTDSPKRTITAAMSGAILALSIACSAPPAGARQAMLPPPWSTAYSSSLEGAPTDEQIAALLPRYGDMDRRKDQVLSRADDRLIRGTIREFGSPAAASAAFSDRGVRFYLEDDYAQAMMRFNQAWLIDSTNPESYYGFAIVYTDHRNHAEAHRWIQEALNRNLSLGVSLADAGLIEARYLKHATTLTEGERTELRSEIDGLFKRAMEQTVGDQRQYVETTRAKALEILGAAGS